MSLPFLLHLPLLFMLTGVDIVVVEKIFREENLWRKVHWWHIAFLYLLVPCLTVWIALFVSPYIALYLSAGVYGGLEDILYFLFQFQLPPERYFWLPDKPSRKALIARTVAAYALAFYFESLKLF